jgi:hypothetical protein
MIRDLIQQKEQIVYNIRSYTCTYIKQYVLVCQTQISECYTYINQCVLVCQTLISSVLYLH